MAEQHFTMRVSLMAVRSQTATRLAWTREVLQVVLRKVEILRADGHVRSLEDIEADVIRHALHVHGGRPRPAAASLRIGRSTLYRRIQELGLATPLLAKEPKT